jgi:hypothetical protein
MPRHLRNMNTAIPIAKRYICRYMESSGGPELHARK